MAFRTSPVLFLFSFCIHLYRMPPPPFNGPALPKEMLATREESKAVNEGDRNQHGLAKQEKAALELALFHDKNLTGALELSEKALEVAFDCELPPEAHLSNWRFLAIASSLLDKMDPTHVTIFASGSLMKHQGDEHFSFTETHSSDLCSIRLVYYYHLVKALKRVRVYFSLCTRLTSTQVREQKHLERHLKGKPHTPFVYDSDWPRSIEAYDPSFERADIEIYSHFKFNVPHKFVNGFPQGLEVHKNFLSILIKRTYLQS